MSDDRENWPALAIDATQHLPVPLTNETETEIKRIFKKKRLANKGPRAKFIRGLEIALGRYKTNRMIHESRGKSETKDDLEIIDEKAQELLKTLNEASLTTKAMIGRALDQGMKQKGPRSFTDLADGTIDIIRATSKVAEYVEPINQQQQYARFAMACDIGEALADLTEGGMLVAGDPDVRRPKVNKGRDGIFNEIFCVLDNQVTQRQEKWPATTLEEGLKRLQHIRALERRAQATDTTTAEAAAAELAGIDRLKDAVAKDYEK
jgi:hypothetical protein